jgi:hypothetical protein
MPIVPHASASGVPVFNSSRIQWTHIGTTSDDALLAFVATVDSQHPDIVSATYSGLPLQVIAETKGPGGSIFPGGYILGILGPSAVSGTVVVDFDEYVAAGNGFSVAVSGLDVVGGSLNWGAGGHAIHPQLPDFLVSQDFTVVHSGILFDLCVAQSSTHTGHLPGPDQTKIADVSLAAARFSVSYRLVNSGTEVVSMSREDCGGPFAGVSLSLAQLKGL